MKTSRLVGAAFGLATALACAAAHAQRLPATLAEAAAIEQRNTLPISAFYDAPASLAASRPGALLRAEAATDYTLAAPGVQATRILYHSVDAEGVDVATSAVVLVPPGTPPAGGWPVIAWGHGTTGVARQCAPSLSRTVSSGVQDLSAMVTAGFAVVATDFHGLGTVGPHRYMDKLSQAWDMVHSVPAARAAVPGLSTRWVASGFSQGGAAAWGVAELQAALRDPGYLGAVAIAGATQLKWALANHPENRQTGHYLAWRAYAIQAYFPGYDPNRLLTPAGMARYKEVTTDGCFLHGLVAYAQSGTQGLLQPNWGKNAYVRHHFEQNEVGRKPLAGPLFVVAGEADTTVPIEATQDAVRAACAAGAQLNFRSYPGLDHLPTMMRTVPDQLAWIKDRFEGKPLAGRCGA